MQNHEFILITQSFGLKLALIDCNFEQTHLQYVIVTIDKSESPTNTL